MFLVVCVTFASFISLSILVEIPSNFHGSREIFSKYLPDRNKHVEAFTYKEDCNVIKGGSQSVSNQLASLNPEGTFEI